MCTRGEEGKFLWINVAGARLAHGFKAAHRISRISRRHKRPVKCRLLKCSSHKIIHSSLVSSGPTALGFVPGSTDEPFILLSKEENMLPGGKRLGSELDFLSIM